MTPTKTACMLLLFIFLSTSLGDLTGTHYLRPIDCPSSTRYLPQGPYLISHHWPWTSITLQYQNRTNTGRCDRNGYIEFDINNNDPKCQGLYDAGKAQLICQFQQNDTQCLVEMTNGDGSPLTCR